MKRHQRPKDALDATPPLFKDLPRLIFCPRGNQRKGHWRSPTDFGRNNSRPSGLQPYCKQCRADEARKDRQRPKPDKRLIKATLRKLDRLIQLLKRIEKSGEMFYVETSPTPPGTPSARSIC